MASFTRVFVWIGVACAALSVLALAQSAFDHSFGRFLSETIASYDVATGYVVASLGLPALIEWSRHALSGLFGWDIQLHKDWKHVFLITSLYFTRNIANNLWSRPGNSLILLFPAIVCAVVGAVGFGWLLASFPILAVAPPVLALASFEYFEALATSYSKHRPAHQTGAETLRYYVKKTVAPRFWLALLVIAMGVVAVLVLSKPQAESALLLLPLVYVAMLAVLLLARGFEVMRNAPTQDGNLLQRLEKSSNSARLGLLIAETLGTAVLVLIASEFGLRPFGF